MVVFLVLLFFKVLMYAALGLWGPSSPLTIENDMLDEALLTAGGSPVSSDILVDDRPEMIS